MGASIVFRDIVFSPNGKNFIVTIYDTSKKTVDYLVVRGENGSKFPTNLYKSIVTGYDQSIANNGAVVFSGLRNDGKYDFFIDKGDGSEAESLGTYGNAKIIISPNGQKVLLAIEGTEVRIYDLKTRKIFIYPLKSIATDINLKNDTAAFIADFKTIVFFKDNKYIKVADFSKEIITEVKGTKGYGGQSPVLAMSDDGTLVVVKVLETANSLGLYFFDGDERREKRTYEINQENDYLISPLIISSNKQRLATQMGSGLWIFNDKKESVINNCFSFNKYNFVENDLFYNCFNTQNQQELMMEKDGEVINFSKNFLIDNYSNFYQNKDFVLIVSSLEDKKTKKLLLFKKGQLYELGEYQIYPELSLNKSIYLTDQNEIYLVSDKSKLLKLKFSFE